MVSNIWQYLNISFSSITSFTDYNESKFQSNSTAHTLFNKAGKSQSHNPLCKLSDLWSPFFGTPKHSACQFDLTKWWCSSSRTRESNSQTETYKRCSKWVAQQGVIYRSTSQYWRGCRSLIHYSFKVRVSINSLKHSPYLDCYWFHQMTVKFYVLSYLMSHTFLQLNFFPQYSLH